MRGITRSSLLNTPFSRPVSSSNRLLSASLIFLLFALGALAIIPAVHAQTGSEVTVASQDTNGNTITSYYMVLYDSSGDVLATGFTPATFSTTSGVTYSIQADSYGSCTFSSWSNGATSDPMTFTATSGTTSFTAIYSCTGSSSGASEVAVNSQASNGTSISGFYTVLYDSSGDVLGTGFTPTTFSTTSGGTYSIQADGYDACTFNSWSDGITNNPRIFTATSNITTFTAIYYCGGSSSGTGGTSQLTVNSVTINGTSMPGFYAELLDSSGDVLATGSTPVAFTVNNGETYSVEVQSYGSYYFQYWQGTGSVTSPVPVTTSTSTTLTAVMCDGPPGTCPDPTPVNGITVYAHRISASYWAPCFALACSAGTGPGATMYFVLEDSSGNVLQTGFANEAGYTFTGLAQGTTYYVYAENCDLCHGSTHDVLFQYWVQGNSTADPIAATVGTSLDAWFSCTNGCSGG